MISILCYTLMAIFFIAGIVFLLKAVLKFRKEFEKINKEMKDGDYNKLSTLLLNDTNNNYKILSKLFKEYDNTVLKNVVNGQVYRYSTIDADYIFNEENVMFKNIPYKSISFAPQVLTGIGIFGTFWGITRGLAPLSDKLGDVSEFQSAIGHLLSGVSTAFYTSLWGILTSIVLSFVIKLATDYVINKTNKFIDILEKDLIRLNEYNVLANIEKQLLNQNELAQSTNTNILGIVNDIFAPKLDIISSKIIEIKDNQQINAEKLASEMINRLEQNINAHIDDLEQRFKLIVDKSEKFVTNFDSSVNSFEKINVAQQNILGEVTVTLEDINESNKVMNQLYIGFKDLFESNRKITEENIETVSSVEATVNKLAECTVKQNDLYDGVDEIIKKSYLINEIQNENIEKIGVMSKEVVNNFGNINNNVREYAEQFENIKNHNVHINNSLTSNYEKVADAFDGISKNLNVSIKNIDSKLIDKINNMNEKSSNVLESYETISENIAMLTEKLERFSKTEEATHTMWAEYKNTFTSIADSIARGIVEYNKEIEKGTVEIFKGYDLEIAKALGYLKETTQEFMQIEETFETLNNNFSGLNCSLENISKLLDDKIGAK